MPYKDPDRQRAWLREKTRRRRKAGLCANCAQPAQPGRARCQECRERFNAKRRKP